MHFDWVTFGLQAVNLLVLLAILKHFFFQPIATMLARRQEQTQAAMDGAAAARSEAERLAAEAEAERSEVAAARKEVLAQANADSEARVAALISDARKQAARIVAEAEEHAERQLAAVDDERLRRAGELAEALARKAVAALPQPPTLEAFARRLADAVAALPADRRQALLGDSDLRLVSAQALGQEELATAQALLAPLGVTVTAGETDPSLITGLELRSDRGTIRNSLAHNLQQLSEALRDDDGPRP